MHVLDTPESMLGIWWDWLGVKVPPWDVAAVAGVKEWIGCLLLCKLYCGNNHLFIFPLAMFDIISILFSAAVCNVRACSVVAWLLKSTFPAAESSRTGLLLDFGPRSWLKSVCKNDGATELEIRGSKKIAKRDLDGNYGPLPPPSDRSSPARIRDTL